MIRRVPPPLAALLLFGCARASDDRFPSLSSRAAERNGFDEPAAAPPTTVQADPVLDARIAAALAASTSSSDPDAAPRRAAAVKVAAATGVPAGGTAWLDAQVALGELDVLRAEGSETVGELEQLATDRGVAGEPPYPALDAAVARLRAALARATATDAALAARLSR